jgi:hypothetical protein
VSRVDKMDAEDELRPLVDGGGGGGVGEEKGTGEDTETSDEESISNYSKSRSIM